MILTTNPRQSIKLYASGGVSYYAAVAEIGAQVEKWRRAFGNLAAESTADLLAGKPVTTEIKTFFVRNPNSLPVRVELSLVESAVSTVLARFDIPPGGRRDYESGRGWLNATSIAGGTTSGTTTMGAVTGKLPIVVEDGEAGPVVTIREATEDDPGTMSGPDKAKLNALTPVDLSSKADLVAGKLPTSQLPDLAISDFLGVAANEAAMLALTGQRGDWCERSDPPGKVWILVADDASLLASWRELVYPASSSHTIGSHTDVAYTETGPADGRILVFDTTDFKWRTRYLTWLLGSAGGSPITVSLSGSSALLGISDATPSASGAMSAADSDMLEAIKGSGLGTGVPPDPAFFYRISSTGVIIGPSIDINATTISLGAPIYLSALGTGWGILFRNAGGYLDWDTTVQSGAAAVQFKDWSGANKTLNFSNGGFVNVT
jgi:hypothetical protein